MCLVFNGIHQQGWFGKQYAYRRIHLKNNIRTTTNNAFVCIKFCIKFSKHCLNVCVYQHVNGKNIIKTVSSQFPESVWMPHFCGLFEIRLVALFIPFSNMHNTPRHCYESSIVYFKFHIVYAQNRHIRTQNVNFTDFSNFYSLLNFFFLQLEVFIYFIVSDACLLPFMHLAPFQQLLFVFLSVSLVPHSICLLVYFSPHVAVHTVDFKLKNSNEKLLSVKTNNTLCVHILLTFVLYSRILYEWKFVIKLGINNFLTALANFPYLYFSFFRFSGCVLANIFQNKITLQNDWRTVKWNIYLHRFPLCHSYFSSIDSRIQKEQKKNITNSNEKITHSTVVFYILMKGASQCTHKNHVHCSVIVINL